MSATIEDPYVQRETKFSALFTPGSSLSSTHFIKVLFPAGLIRKPETETCSMELPSSRAGTCAYTVDEDNYVTEIKFNQGICSSGCGETS